VRDRLLTDQQSQRLSLTASRSNWPDRLRDASRPVATVRNRPLCGRLVTPMMARRLATPDLVLNRYSYYLGILDLKLLVFASLHLPK
jgi:hypothetical protein